MRLQAVLGVALMFARGNAEAAQRALEASLAIAEARGGASDQLQVLNLLHIFHQRTGDFKSMLHYARRSFSVADAIATPEALGLAHCLVGSALHHAGDLDGARAELEAALQSGPNHRPTSTIYVEYEHYNYAGIALARTLWLQGFPVQAMEMANQSVKDAMSMGHPVAVSRALVWAVSVFLWAGDLQSAEANTDLLVANAESQAMGPYLAVGRGYKGALAIRRGDAKAGVENLIGSLETLRAARYGLMTTTLNGSLALGFAALRRSAEGIALIDQTIKLVEIRGDVSHMPELLRIKGGLLLSLPQRRADEAAACLTQSLELSRRQGARAWELRTATDLTALWVEQGRAKDARALLKPIFGQFTEGADTPDLKAAEHLLTTLG